MLAGSLIISSPQAHTSFAVVAQLALMVGLDLFQAFSWQQFDVPALFQDQVPQANVPIHPQRPSCPKCGKGFSRKPERNRHIRTSHLPHSIYCPFPRCAWRSGRYEQLTQHWATKHPNHGPTPGRQQSQIYDADQLVGLVVCGVCTVELVVQFALTEVERRTWEVDKVGVWANAWGRRLRPGQ